MKKIIRFTYNIGILLIIISAFLLLKFVWAYEPKPAEYSSVENCIEQLSDKKYVIDYFKRSGDYAYISATKSNRQHAVILIKQTDKWIELQKNCILNYTGEFTVDSMTEIYIDSF